MVSRVLCQRHPEAAQFGVLACPHVAAALGSADGTKPSRLIVDDEELETRFTVLACPDCCAEFGFEEERPVPAEIFWSESSFPGAAPICSRCAREAGFLPQRSENAV